jgi:hypothetical protein
MSLTKQDLKLIEDLLDRKLDEKLDARFREFEKNLDKKLELKFQEFEKRFEEKLDLKLQEALEKNNNILITLIDDKIADAVNDFKIYVSGNFVPNTKLANHELRITKIEKKLF